MFRSVILPGLLTALDITLVIIFAIISIASATLIPKSARSIFTRTEFGDLAFYLTLTTNSHTAPSITPPYVVSASPVNAVMWSYTA